MNKASFLVAVLLLGLLSAGPLCAEEPSSIYAFTVKTIDGEEKSLGDFRGKTLLIVNTATQCGYKEQLKTLDELYRKYKDRGFTVLAFPANNFKSQEPGTNEEIKNICLLNYNVSYPLFAKISVLGDDIDPLYQYLTAGSGFNGAISWNYTKFLIDPKGSVVGRFEPAVDPMSPEIDGAVAAILPPAPVCNSCAEKRAKMEAERIKNEQDLQE